ncbi:MAG: hypothetical protein AAF985_13250 [Bacteroidota bacterium]
MNYPYKLEQLSQQLSHSTDPLERYEIMIELSVLYKKMWKMKKALEISQEALALSKKLIYAQYIYPPFSKFDERAKKKSLLVGSMG